MGKESVRTYIRSLLHSYTLVFFSKNNWFGLILLIVSFFDLYTGIAGLLSVVITNAFALMLGLNYKKISSGYYGFNSLLTGLGIGMAIQPSPAFYIILVFISLTTLLLTLVFEGIFYKYSLPFLTIPFLIALWITIAATRSYTVLSPNESGIFSLNTMYLRGGQSFVDMYLWFDDLSWPVYIKTYFKSLGAIIFQYHLLSGILIAAGLLLYSRIAFLYSVIGFTSAWLFYIITGANIHELDYSYIGFNHILTAIAIGCFFTVASGWSLLWVILLTPVVTMLISASGELLSVYQLPVFSVPFNLVVIVFLYALKFRERMITRPEVVTIQHFSPEENLYASINAGERFRNSWYFPISLPFFGFRNISQAHNGEVTHKDEWRHAWDFVITDENGKEYADNGLALTDYYCFNKPVLAPADGFVQQVIDYVDDNEPGKTNLQQNWGNSIVIKHTEQLYTKVSHLRKGSITVSEGTYVKKGQIIAQSGNSGRSPYPHLHFQVQSNPDIGSATIKYPIAQYITLNGSHQLKLYNIPSINDQVSNIQAEPSLEKAFNFIPGQTIKFIAFNGSEGKWEVKTDSYNNMYLECLKTGAIAWFRTNEHLFFFTHFEGDRESELYYFFLGAYQIPLGYYSDLKVKDVFPPTVLKYSPVRFLQDIVAPFFLFLKPSYSMMFGKKEEDITGNKLEVITQSMHRLFGISFMKLECKLKITGSGFDRMQILKNSKESSITFIR